MSQSDRTIGIIGEENLEILRKSRVAVFGAGGVGAAVIEGLARAEVGTIDIVDKDVISESNINRQLIALHSTIGRPKVEAARERILDINPKCMVNTYEMFFHPDNAYSFNFEGIDFVADAIDTVSAKLELISICDRLGIPVISSMGTGNKLHPEMFEITDIFKTEMDPLAKVVRKELRNRGIRKLKVVYSKEEPVKTGNRTPASISFTPPVAGYIMAGEIIRNLIAMGRK